VRWCNRRCDSAWFASSRCSSTSCSSTWCSSTWNNSPRHRSFHGILRFGGNARQAPGQNIDGACCARLVGLGPPFVNLRYHEHFFQLAEIGGGTHSNIEKELAARSHFCYPAHQQALGKNSISAAGKNQLPGGHGFIAHDFLEHHFACRR